MSSTARTILRFRERAESLRLAYTTTPIWGVDSDAQRLWEAEGICYRMKDANADAWLSGRYRAAADWLEARAGADTLRTLYPTLSIR